MAADEFLDSDGDNLPDWWDNGHFGSATAAEPDANPEGDGLTNLQEYKLYSSDPNTEPICVDDVTGPQEDGSIEHPFDTIQKGLNAGDEVEFTFLRNELKLSDGNLSVQIRKLEKAGYTKVKKVFVERKPQTFCKITAKGRKAMLRLLKHLENLVRQSK